MRCSGSEDKVRYCFELKTGFEVRCLLPAGQKGLSELGSGAGEVHTGGGALAPNWETITDCAA